MVKNNESMCYKTDLITHRANYYLTTILLRSVCLCQTLLTVTGNVQHTHIAVGNRNIHAWSRPNEVKYAAIDAKIRWIKSHIKCQIYLMHSTVPRIERNTSNWQKHPIITRPHDWTIGHLWILLTPLNRFSGDAAVITVTPDERYVVSNLRLFRRKLYWANNKEITLHYISHYKWNPFVTSGFL